MRSFTLRFLTARNPDFSAVSFPWLRLEGAGYDSGRAQPAQNRQLTEVTITEARRSLTALVDQAREAPVFLTRRNRTVAVIVGGDRLEHLRADADELADMRAVDLVWQEANELREAPILGGFIARRSS